MNKRQWIVAGIGAAVVALMYTFPSLRHLLGVTSLWWHRVIGCIAVLTPAVVFALKHRKPQVRARRDKTQPISAFPTLDELRRGFTFLLWTPLVVLGLLVLIPITAFTLTLPFTYDIEFDPVDWQRDSGRDRMTNDLMENHLRVGMMKAEAEKMLGAGDGGVFGAWSTTGGVPTILYVQLDEDERVTGFKLIDHD